MAGKYLKKKKTVVGGDIGPAAALDSPAHTNSKVGRQLPIKKIAVGILVLLLCVLGAFVLSQRNDRDTQTDFVKACNDDVIARAVKYLGPDNGEKLHEVAHEISQIPQYNQDPNCLYIVIIDYINSSEAAAAKSSFEKYKLLYEPSRTSEILVNAPTGMLSVEEMEETINSIEKINDENAKSHTPFNVEGPAQ